MSKEDKSQQTESPRRQTTEVLKTPGRHLECPGTLPQVPGWLNRQATEVLKALSHFEYPTEVSQVPAWLEKTKPLKSLIRSLCEKDRTGRLTLECVYVLFDLMATQGEAVSPAVWDFLETVEEDSVKYLVDAFLKDTTPRLKNGLLSLLTGACTCGLRIPKLQVWCHAFIQALEDKQKYYVLLSVSQDVARKLLHGIVFPHTRTLVLSLFERLLYPMTRPHVFNLVVDGLPEVLQELENDEACQRLVGLAKALLKRFPPGPGKEESYKRLGEALGKHWAGGGYDPGYPLWNQKPKCAGKLSGILECPVCYERFVTPITVCENGHCICSNCKDRLKNCPICRGHISNTRMTIMDQIVEVTEFHCKNFDAGCSVKLPYRDVWNHELSCEYRTISCDIISSQNPPKLLCNEDVVVLYFHEHMEKCHKEFVKEFELNDKRRGELRRQKVNEVRLLKNSDGSLHFIERIYVTDEEIFFAYYYVGKSDNASNYVYTVKINGGGLLQKVRYTNFCLPNYMGVIDTEVDERCLILEPEKIFFAQRSKFEYSVKIEDVNVYRLRSKKNKFFVSN